MPRISFWLSTRAALASSFFLVHLPFAAWYVRRMLNGVDDALCLLPAVLAFGSIPRSGWLSFPSRNEWLGSFALHLVLLSLTFPLRPLVFGLVLGSVWAWVFRAQHGHWGRLLLLVAALPSGPSLQFYLGFPLRRLTTELSSLALNFFSMGPVLARGTVLVGASGEVAVDAPCAGTHALWVATVAVGFVFLVSPVSFGRALCAGLLALTGVLCANAIRSALLYAFLTDRWPQFPGFHAGVGLACFAAWFFPWLYFFQLRSPLRHA